jgi:hypothetical protein
VTADKEPFAGSRVRITVTMDGEAIVDTDLSQLYYISRFVSEDLVPFYFLPNGTDDKGEPVIPADLMPVRAMLSLREMDINEP